ncbi:MAG: VOC family protein [Chloroflexota bacterium]|nr:MAG: glyoxalase [Chloroflexota bacterium]
MALSVQVVMDCADPARLAEFWAAVLGYKIQDPPEGFASWEEALTAWGVPKDQWNSASAVVDPEGRGPRIYFQRVPEPKVVKNRVHLDVSVSGGPGTPLEERRARVDAAVERVIGLGATRVRAYEQRGEYWVVMQDPEGNEFCLQ